MKKKKLFAVLSPIIMVMCLCSSCFNISPTNKENAFEKEQKAKDAIESHYSAIFTDFELVGYKTFAKSFNGYNGIIEFTYTNNGKKFFCVNTFKADEWGSVEEVSYSSNVPWEDYVRVQKWKSENQ